MADRGLTTDLCPPGAGATRASSHDERRADGARAVRSGSDVSVDASDTREAAVGPELHAYTLRLRGVRFSAHIGASAEERGAAQELIVDLDVWLPIDALPQQDRLGDVTDYDAVVRHLVDEGTSQSYHLLETYATRVVGRLLSALPALRVRVAVTKSNVPTKYPVAQAVVEIVAGPANPDR